MNNGCVDCKGYFVFITVPVRGKPMTNTGFDTLILESLSACVLLNWVN